MKRSDSTPSVMPSFVEALEPRIAPAGINENGMVVAVAGSSVLLNAGQGLGSGGPFGGSYYLYVEKGQALVFTTDLNGNGSVDFDEITGVSAGNGLRLLSFVDIHGDIVTNLNSDGTLTDSDGNATNGRDGRIVLDSRIESITLRSLVDSDLNTGVVGNTAYNRTAPSNYSIFGNIYAGGGLGVGGSGLLIDTAGFGVQEAKYNLNNRWYDDVEPIPSIGFIYTGSAVSGKSFTFGTSPIYGEDPGESLRGTLVKFVPAAGQIGGDVIGVRAGENTTTTTTSPTGEITETTTFDPVPFHIGGIRTGDGGFGARGGDIRTISLMGDVGGFFAVAGNGGDGTTGGNGGSIIGFAITESPNATVELRTGDGGRGLIGAAGQAGLFQPDGTLEIYGNLTVGLGKGGDALGNAGAGTSLQSANFSLFTVGDAVPANFISTMRAPGDLGSTTPFDFDGDGFYDIVFLTQNTQQLAVAFGDGGGGFESQYLILEPGSYASPETRLSTVVVGDFNADGRPDIATASSAGTGFGGITTYINRGPDETNVWIGFDDPRYSPTPYGEYGVNTNLAVGDFNDDGVVDLGLITLYKFSTAVFAELTLMSGLKGANGQADGYFAADFGLGTGNVATKSPVVTASSTKIENEGEFVVLLKATASVPGDSESDILAVLTRPIGTQGSVFSTFSYDNDAGGLSLLSTLSPSFSQRSIEENVLVYGEVLKLDAFDFAFADADDDGDFDVVLFGSAGGFTAAAVLEGSSDGTVEQPLIVDSTGAYFGIALTSETAQIPSVLGSRAELDILRAVEFGTDNNVAFGSTRGSGSNIVREINVFEVTGFGQSDGLVFNPDDSTTGFNEVGDGNKAIMMFDTYLSDPTDSLGFAGLTVTPASPWQVAGGGVLISNSLVLQAGDGGSSLLGSGGAGGSLGTGSATSIDGVLTGSIVVSGFSSATFETGRGGTGFLNGGRAGSLQGIATLGVERTFTTNSGGAGLLGTGGSGGNIANIFYQGVNTTAVRATLELFTGGGGFGLRGGNAGNVLGAGSDASPEAFVSALTIQTGDGGFGISAGGHGGSIQNFRPQMAVDALWFSRLSYTTGNGGNTSAGSGGIGGNILNSGPTSDYNLLAVGDVSIVTGTGGGGLAGGTGGSIDNFINRPTGPNNPGDVEVVAGDGGTGMTGSGGAGGKISGVQLVSSSSLMKVIAGDGGASAGATGGAGGSLINVQGSADSGALVAAAGEGGAGLVAGGSGGNVSNSTLNASALNNGRMLAIGGNGGDAFGVTLTQVQKENPAPNPSSAAGWALFQQIWAIGTANGRGGVGGSLSGITQPSSILVSSDLFAGNGGDTVNYGFTSDRTTGVGRGGSISNIKLAGDAGIINKDTPIRSYVPYGGSMASFVQDVRDGNVSEITAQTGNVGVVVGNSGSVRNGAPSSAGLAGSVTNFEARNIMSMVAGSVDRLAAILSVSGVKVQTGGLIGVFKEGTASEPIVPHINNNAYYSGPNYSGPVQENARPGGSLVDGAVLTFRYSGSDAQRLFDL